MENGCDFVANALSASHMGGIWERQIRTIQTVLTATLTQENSRLDGSFLRTFFDEAMAIVNHRPLSEENQNDPCRPTPLTPKDILTMKTSRFPKRRRLCKKKMETSSILGQPVLDEVE